MGVLAGNFEEIDQRPQLLVAQVSEPPLVLGGHRFVDPETNAELPIAVADMRTEYRDAVTNAIREWRQTLVPMGVDYNLLLTDQSMARPLRAYLRKREKLG